MADVPKIVLERLKAASARPAEHPDADVLTAFAERALPNPGRDFVLEHLAACGECREVVALALPASETAVLPVAHSRGNWLTWPAMRWGFAAAGIVLVASLAIVRYQRHTRESVASNKGPAVSEAKNEASSTALPPASTAPASAAPASALQDADKERDKSESPTAKLLDNLKAKKTPAAADAVPAFAPPPVPQNSRGDAHAFHGAVGGPLPHGPKMGIQMNQANQWQQQNANANAYVAGSAAAPAPSPAQNVANLPVSGRSDLALDKIQAEPHGQSVDTLTVQSETLSQQLPQGGTAEQKVDRAKPLETVIVSTSKRYAGAPPSAKLARSSPLASAQWTINPSGGLQRSVDKGATWQDVNVNGSAPAGASELYGAREERRVAQEKITLKDRKQAAGPMIFRAVAANGPDVWAGGVNGTLYHSTDAGIHWIRIVPASSGMALTGDIVSVNFSDAQHGRVLTSTSEAWTTGDGGESWQKQ